MEDRAKVRQKSETLYYMIQPSTPENYPKEMKSSQGRFICISMFNKMDLISAKIYNQSRYVSAKDLLNKMCSTFMKYIKNEIQSFTMEWMHWTQLHLLK